MIAMHVAKFVWYAITTTKIICSDASIFLGVDQNDTTNGALSVLEIADY